jgi:hypothetical protein
MENIGHECDTTSYRLSLPKQINCPANTIELYLVELDDKNYFLRKFGLDAKITRRCHIDTKTIAETAIMLSRCRQEFSPSK